MGGWGSSLEVAHPINGSARHVKGARKFPLQRVGDTVCQFYETEPFERIKKAENDLIVLKLSLLNGDAAASTENHTTREHH